MRAAEDVKQSCERLKSPTRHISHACVGSNRLRGAHAVSSNITTLSKDQVLTLLIS